MIVLNEIKQAEFVLQTGRVNKKSTVTIMLLAKYYLRYRNFDETETYIELDKFLKKNYPYYNKVRWANKLKTMISKATKYNLRQIDHISVSSQEIEKIQELDSVQKQRVLFTMLCLAKTYNTTSSINNNWVNTTLEDIFQSARVHPRNADDKYFMLNDFIRDGYIEPATKIDNLNFRITFIGGDDEALQISSLDELGFEWNNYNNLGNYNRCIVCGRLYKVNKRCGKYCNICAQEIKKEQDKNRKTQFGEFKTLDFPA